MLVKIILSFFTFIFYFPFGTKDSKNLIVQYGLILSFFYLYILFSLKKKKVYTQNIQLGLTLLCVLNIASSNKIKKIYLM